MSQKNFVKRASLTCDESKDYWDKLKVHTYSADVKVNISGNGTVCFQRIQPFI